MNSLLTLAAAGSPSSMQLIIASVLGVALILYLIIVIKLHAFVTLLLVSFLVGLGAGMPITSKTTIRVVLGSRCQ